MNVTGSVYECDGPGHGELRKGEPPYRLMIVADDRYGPPSSLTFCSPDCVAAWAIDDQARLVARRRRT